MNLYEITDIIGAVTLVQLVLFSAYLLTQVKNAEKKMYYLSGFLGVSALFMFEFLFDRMKFASLYGIPDFTIFLSAFSFFFGPTLYFYTRLQTGRSKSDQAFRFSLIPFLAGLIISLALPEKSHLISRAGYLFYSGVFMVLSIAEIIKYRNKIKNYYSNTARINLTWLLIVNSGFTLMWFSDFSNYILGGQFNIITSDTAEWFTFISVSFNFFFANLITFITLKNMGIPGAELPEEEKAKPQQEILDQATLREYKEKVKSLLARERLYLNPDVTLQDFAAQLGINARYLSYTINTGFGKTFFELINEYRIMHARGLLLEEGAEKRTVLEVMYESGFNSKSAFNTAFKKYTGLTPSGFKNTRKAG